MVVIGGSHHLRSESLERTADLCFETTRSEWTQAIWDVLV